MSKIMKKDNSMNNLQPENAYRFFLCDYRIQNQNQKMPVFTMYRKRVGKKLTKMNL